MKKQPKNTYTKKTMTMPDSMLVHLETIGQISNRTGGHKLAKTEIVRAMVTAMSKMKIDVTGLKNRKDLDERIMASIRAYR